VNEETRAQVARFDVVMLHVAVSADWATRELNAAVFDQYAVVAKLITVPLGTDGST
jgi:hypothetical protein